MAILTWLGVPGEEAAWQRLGFDVADGPHGATVTVGRVAHVLGEEPSWWFDALHGDPEGLGVPTRQVARQMPQPDRPGRHPNLIDRVDHVVYAVASLDDAIRALSDVLGEEPRRRARPRGPSGPEMAFYRVGEGFIEVVESGRPAALWGIAFSSPDLDATVAAIRAAGGPVGDPKPAVQGGRISSVWKGHVGWGIAIMEPPTDEEAGDGQG